MSGNSTGELRTHSSKVLPLKPGVGQYIAMHATLTVRDFFLANFYPSVHSPAFFQTLSQVFHVLAAANTGSCVGPQNKIGHFAGCRFPCLVLAEYQQTPNYVSMFFLVLRSEIVDRICAVV